MTTEASPVPSPASLSQSQSGPEMLTGAEAVVRSLELVGSTDV
jgi:acetolactate synthase-1/2/3 large subunit